MQKTETMTAAALATTPVSAFVDAVRRVAGGGTVLDPEVVAALLARPRPNDPLARLTAREREVLGLMAEGWSNAAIAARLFVTDKAVSKHTNGRVDHPKGPTLKSLWQRVMSQDIGDRCVSGHR